MWPSERSLGWLEACPEKGLWDPQWHAGFLFRDGICPSDHTLLPWCDAVMRSSLELSWCRCHALEPQNVELNKSILFKIIASIFCYNNTKLTNVVSAEGWSVVWETCRRQDLAFSSCSGKKFPFPSCLSPDIRYPEVAIVGLFLVLVSLTVTCNNCVICSSLSTGRVDHGPYLYLHTNGPLRTVRFSRCRGSIG